MDRSERRTAVIAWAMTAGVMFGGAAPAAPAALADDRGSDATGSVDVAPQHRTRTPSTIETRTTSPTPAVRGPGSPVGAPSPDPAPPGPCPWFPALSAPPARNTQGGLVIGSASLPPVTPVPIFGDRRAVIGGVPDADIAEGLPPLQSPESPPVGNSVFGSAPSGVPSAPSGQGPGVPSALVAPSPVVPPAVPIVAAAPVGPPALSVPDFPAPGLAGPVPAAPAARPAAPHLPEPPAYLPELRPDDLGRIAETALPGLAVLAGMTLLGGVIGFRQARAGYLLRAAGAGRFLQ